MIKPITRRLLPWWCVSVSQCKCNQHCTEIPTLVRPATNSTSGDPIPGVFFCVPSRSSMELRNYGSATTNLEHDCGLGLSPLTVVCGTASPCGPGLSMEASCRPLSLSLSLPCPPGTVGRLAAHPRIWNCLTFLPT